MRWQGARFALALDVPTRGVVGLIVALIVALGAAACTPSETSPAPTLVVAGETDAPPPNGSGTPSGQPEEPGVTPAPTEPPPFEPEPTAGPETTTAIIPGTVDRSSLVISATYRINATITVKTGALDVSTRIEARNDSGEGIDRLELNTIAASLGGIRVYEATVDDVPVAVAVRDQTLVVPLGGTLPAGASTTVRIAYRATLRNSVTGSDWMFTRRAGTLALYRWIPWVSKAVPFDRSNFGDPFVTPTSPQVDVEILTDEHMVIAAPAARVDEYTAGSGSAWSFSLQNVRDVSVVLAPDFKVARGKVEGIPIRAFARPGGLSATQLLDLATQAVSSEADRLGVAYPWTVLAVVETQGGDGLESPGLVWIPERASALNRTYFVYQGTAHQWFYGLVGNDQRAEPFADEAPADLLARTVLGTLRASRCGSEPLDDPITGYSRSCYYEIIHVQGGRVLDDIRRQMGTTGFWAAMKAYLEDNRYGLAGTRQLLETLRAASPVNLLPTLNARFPDLY